MSKPGVRCVSLCSLRDTSVSIPHTSYYRLAENRINLVIKLKLATSKTVIRSSKTGRRTQSAKYTSAAKLVQYTRSGWNHAHMLRKIHEVLEEQWHGAEESDIAINHEKHE